ncbi:MAG: hypothetical protein GWN21_16650 [Gammaproteobacteria bacterium]|nr:hypothetical protein [Gammaproteobacteria bacterium]NIR24764.1 hypothetical protein [Gammaproteobacteria bacterium]NIS05111.1 hypothetical protein [Gammaproteobacteria bacterium]NIU42517.1 hypothetical protein [Gammaproteobacteria bacterium]NIV49289.1 hypothetical protein [Gammaproteobacteria bacterium]
MPAEPMRDELRARIAYVAARLIVEHDAKEIHDHTRTTDVHIEGLVSQSAIDVFDFSSGCRLAGEQSDEGYSLFDYDANQYVDLNLDGEDFEGFDYATGTRYTGEVRDRSVRIFDYGESTDFEYSLKSPN